MSKTSSVEAEMIEFAEDGVKFAKQQYSVDLDYSEESVKVVEEILADLHAIAPKGFIKGLFKKKALSREQVEQLSMLLGAYVGEVMKRKWSGHWTESSDAFPGEQIATLHIPPSNDLWPHLKVGKRLMNGAEDNVWHYYLYFKDSLSKS